MHHDLAASSVAVSGRTPTVVQTVGGASWGSVQLYAVTVSAPA
jgi:hypothetical protein